MAMNGFPPGQYAAWRTAHLAPCTLHETVDTAPPAERLLQAVWHHQRLLREQLQTLDGRKLRVLHPGFRNSEAGPDFRNAVVQFDVQAPQSGDVEIDLQSAHWKAHGHHVSAAFKNVLLHVVWDFPASSPALPTMVLKPMLDAPLTELALWLGSDAAQDWPRALSGRCSGAFQEMDDNQLGELLQQAGRSRLEAKAVQFQARARQAGWDQALREGLFRALGYKHNVWPMQRLAELLPRWLSGDAERSLAAIAWQARLLGLSGLLPEDPSSSSADTGLYLRRLWDHWWREREPWIDDLLPRRLWCFHGLRPANHPARRLALASHWLAAGDLPARLEKWFTLALPEASLPQSLLALLQVEQDDFWTWHWTFRSKRMSQPQPLLGATRVTDLAVNVVLPWFWIRAVSGKNEALQREAERRYFCWPQAEDNAVLRLARRRLLGGERRNSFTSACRQQGLLQIVRDFCDHSNAVCDDCRFPELLRGGGGSGDCCGTLNV